ncbi:putative type I fatty acid synthase [Cryptosporidium serpentis]
MIIGDSNIALFRVTVQRSSVNPRDVLNVMGLYPGDPGPPGGDCSGIVVAIGEGVSHLQVGDYVFGVAPGCLKTYVTTDANLMCKIPDGFSFEEAAALPVVATTVELALKDIANIKSGDHVLVHAVTGGIGLMVVQYCKIIGAKVYGTAGSDTKIEYAKSIGVEVVSSSRDSSRFVKDMEQYIGKLDIVINSLIENFIPTSLELLKPNGHFIELGKRGIWSDEDVTKIRPDINYTRVAVDVMMEEKPIWFRNMLDRIRNLANEKKIQPLPMKIFNMRDYKGENDGIAAFRFMQRAQHIGKVIINIPSPFSCNIIDSCKNSSECVVSKMTPGKCLVTGGFGSLGLITISWLISEGVTDIVILSRRKCEPVKGSNSQWDHIKAILINNPEISVEHIQCDISKKQDLYNIMSKLKNIQHIFHIAGAISDAQIKDQDSSLILAAYQPKAIGAWNLHNICQELGINNNLKSFVMFSSVSAVLGNFGQLNYSAANACLDALASYRNKLGYCGQSIQWGPWIEQGMAINLKKDIERAGMKGITNEIGLKILSDVMLHSDLLEVVSCLSIKWQTYIERVHLGQSPAFLSMMEIKEQFHGSSIVNSLVNLSPEQRFEYVETEVRSLASSVLGITVDSLDAPLQNIGIDSLAALEFRNSLCQKFKIKLSVTMLFDYPTLRSIVTHICEKVEDKSFKASASVISQDRSNMARASSSENVGIIVGMACRLPGGANTPQGLWTSLINGYSVNPLTNRHINSIDGVFCAVRDIPLSRWNNLLFYNSDPDMAGKSYTNKGCFIDAVELFDNQKFKIPNIEANYMDPQQRILLEISYEALIDASYSEETLLGTNIGVFVGCCSNDWSFLQNRKIMAPFTGTGAANTTISNRVSFVFGLKGPSMTVDTACASSLTAICVAMDCFKNDECNGAIVGGVHNLLSPNLFIAFSKARMLSPNGFCKTFDASANGYVRGEGCGTIVMLKASEYEKRKTPILGVIRGWACNHVGRSVSLTAPNGPSQSNVISSALSKAKLQPNQIDYIETHGTGTSLGDPIEIGALKNIFGGSNRDSPLVLGALKTNIGHLEGAAGISGLIKLILVLQHRKAPKIAHLKNLNPHIDIEGFNVLLPQNLLSLSSTKKKLIGGVSGFGFGGCNAHVIVEAPTKDEMEKSVDPDLNKPNITFVFTGQGSQYVNMCREFYDTESVFKSSMDLCNQLLHPILKRPLLSIIYPDLYPSKSKDNSQEEVKCDENNLTETSNCGKKNEYEEDVSLILNHTSFAQPAIFSVEYALARLWISKGIVPSSVMGHSLGEFVAAVISQVMSLEDAIVLVARRAEIMASLPLYDGIMVACRLTEEKVLNAIKKLNFESSVAVAAINGPNSVTISGSRESIMKMLKYLGMENRFKQLDVSHAFHSPLVSKAEPLFLEYLKSVNLKKPVLNFISTVSGKSEQEFLATPEYWSRHILNPVRLHDAVVFRLEESLEKPNVFVEVASRPVLTQLIKASIPSHSSANILCTALIKDSKYVFKEALDKAITNLVNKYDSNNKTSNSTDSDLWRSQLLQRREIPWIKTAHPIVIPLQDLSDNEWISENIPLGQSNASDLLQRLKFCCRLNLDILELFENHKVLGKSILPGAAYVDLLANAAVQLASSQVALGVKESMPDWVCIKHVAFLQPFPLSSASKYPLLKNSQGTIEYCEDNEIIDNSDFYITISSRNGYQISIQSDISERKDLMEYAVCSGIEFLNNNEARQRNSSFLSSWPDLESISSKNSFSVDAVYSGMYDAGLQYGSRFKTLKQMWKISENTAFGVLQIDFENLKYMNNDPLAFYEAFNNERGFVLHPTLLDGALHMCASLLGDLDELEHPELNRRVTMVPVSLNMGYIPTKTDQLSFLKGEKLWAYIQLVGFDKESASVNVVIKNSNLEPIIFLIGVTLRSVKHDIVSNQVIKFQNIPKEILWKIDWVNSELVYTRNELLLALETKTPTSSLKIKFPMSKNFKILLLTCLDYSQKMSKYPEKIKITTADFSQMKFEDLQNLIIGKESPSVSESSYNHNWDLICIYIPPQDDSSYSLKYYELTLNICKVTKQILEFSGYSMPSIRVITTNLIYTNDDQPSEFPKIDSGLTSLLRSARQELELSYDKIVKIGFLDIERNMELIDAILFVLFRDIAVNSKSEDYTLQNSKKKNSGLFVSEYEPEYAIRISDKNSLGSSTEESTKFMAFLPIINKSEDPDRIIGSMKLYMSNRGSLNNLDLLPLYSMERAKPTQHGQIEIQMY